MKFFALEPSRFILCSQEPATGLYPEPVSLRYILISYSYIYTFVCQVVYLFLTLWGGFLEELIAVWLVMKFPAFYAVAG
jgi:hypothetical protein